MSTQPASLNCRCHWTRVLAKLRHTSAGNHCGLPCSSMIMHSGCAGEILGIDRTKLFQEISGAG